MARVSIFLMIVALIAGMVGCALFPSRSLEIRTWYDLDAIRNNIGGHCILMNDLDATTAGYEELASPTANNGDGWHPLGTQDKPFTGTFDGQGYKIRDLFINLPGKGYVGLFSIVGKGGVIKNLGMVNVNVNSTAYIGSLVGVNQGTVSNSYSSGGVAGILSVGGLVGYSDGTVSNSYSTGNITSDYGAGGLVGGNSGTIINSYATGGVTGGEGAGGLVGTSDGTVINSYSLGNVTGNVNVGGLVGYSEGTVSSSFWDVQTSGQNASAGGIGRTTAEMKSIATFSGAGWNIAAVALNETNPVYIWNIVTGQTYPFLSWQP